MHPEKTGQFAEPARWHVSRLSGMRSTYLFRFLLFWFLFVASTATGVFEVRATSGNTHLGGEDFDQRLMKYCIAQVGSPGQEMCSNQ